MKHRGKAAGACVRMLAATLAGCSGLALLFGLAGEWAWGRGWATALGILGLWSVFALFCLWFFRDPDPAALPEPGLYLAPAHGKVDVIEQTTESEFIAGPCRRVSIFLSVFDVHVQKAPVAGRLVYLRRHAGEFLNAMRLDSAAVNENVMLGFETAEGGGEKVGVRLIAGVLARRILPWAAEGESVARGERISLIQFGSRVDLYLPLTAKLQVQVGDRVRGGITVMATRS